MPTFAADGWTIGKPDVVFEMKEPFQIPARGTIEYQYIRIPTGITEDKWLQAIEIKPQARAHVHHVIAFTVPAGSPISEQGALGPGNIGGVTPNKPGVVFEPGVGRLLTGNSDIVLQMHYTTNGEADDGQDAGRRGVREGAAAVAAARRQRACTSASRFRPARRRTKCAPRACCRPTPSSRRSRRTCTCAART